MPHRLFLWLLRAWPVLAVGFLVFVHFLILWQAGSHTVFIHKLTGTVMQIAGGLVVLHSVNDNLGLFRSQSLFSVVAEWFRSFPLIKQTTAISVGIAMSSGSASALGFAAVVKAPATLEERVALIEQAVAELRTDIGKQKTELTAMLEKTKAELRVSISTNQSAIESLAAKIETATVGGFKQQAFGVMLAVYGAIVSVFA